MNENKTKFMRSEQEGVLSTHSGKPLKLIDQFTYLGSNISFTEINVNLRRENANNAIDRLSVIWNPNLSYKIKQDFFQTVAVSYVQYRCNTWMQTQCIEKRLHLNNTRTSRVVFKRSWKQHPPKKITTVLSLTSHLTNHPRRRTKHKERG